MANSCSVVEPNYRSSTFPRKRWNRQSWQIDKNSEAFSTNFFKGIRFFIKEANPGHFFVHFRSFQTTIEFLQQMYVKNVHPGYGAGIRTHDLWNVSLFPTLSRDKLASLANVFLTMGHSQPLFFIFRLFNVVDRKQSSIKSCRWRYSNRGPLVLEATALSTDPHLLPQTWVTFYVAF